MYDFLSDDHSRVAELIHEYDSSLSVELIQEESREIPQFPYRIMHTREDGSSYPVRYVSIEDMNPKLLAWVYANDMVRNPKDLLQYLELQEKAKKAVEDKRMEDILGESRDLVSSIVGGKNWYKHNGITYS